MVCCSTFAAAVACTSAIIAFDLHGLVVAAVSNVIMALPAAAEAGKLFDFNLTLPISEYQHHPLQQQCSSAAQASSSNSQRLTAQTPALGAVAAATALFNSIHMRSARFSSSVTQTRRAAAGSIQLQQQH